MANSPSPEVPFGTEDSLKCEIDPSDEMAKREEEITPITERIEELRTQSVEKDPELSPERAVLLTEFYENKDQESDSTPVTRAKSFKYLMENVSLPVEEGQLIVGLRGTGVKEIPTFPEISTHSSSDLDILDSREKNPYHVDQETKEDLKSAYAHWEGESMRERVFSAMDDEWMDAYEAGVFTEFMEQRSPGHTAGGSKIFETGVSDIIDHAERKLNNIPDNGSNSSSIEELKAMIIAGEAIIEYANRYASKLEELSENESDGRRAKELRRMSEICRNVPESAPETFWEALQHYWFIHVGIVTETNPWDSFSPGRLDQHLIQFYENDSGSDELSRERAKELLEAFWLKFNAQPAPPKVGVTAKESNTYNDFTKINIGGIDEEGSNGVNDVSYLLLEVLKEMRTLQPQSAALISKKVPDHFVEKALDVVKPGYGDPPFFNQDEMEKLLLRQGKNVEDARLAGASGCVESGVFGKESYILTGYFNLPKVFEITLNNGTDPETNKQIGVESGNPEEFEDFDDVLDAFTTQLEYFIDVKMKGNDRIEELYSEHLPVPFLSMWMEDCVENSTDYNSGGTRYNTQYIQIVGLGTIADSLASLKYNVFDNQEYSLSETLEAINTNFSDHETMKQRFLNKTPKYGRDDDYADDLAKSILNKTIDIVESYPPSPVRDASRHVFGLPTTAHVYFGSVCGATPDGRTAGEPLSEGISPVQGMDTEGPSAVFRSIGKIDHVRTGGTLLNQKLSPDLVTDSEANSKLAQLLRGYFKMDAHHVQFNVVSADLLREAKRNPEEFDNLMVRVAGYSDYFVNLPEGLQNEIIKRTEHTGY